jgi:hypothetical protein
MQAAPPAPANRQALAWGTSARPHFGARPSLVSCSFMGLINKGCEHRESRLERLAWSASVMNRLLQGAQLFTSQQYLAKAVKYGDLAKSESRACGGGRPVVS